MTKCKGFYYEHSNKPGKFLAKATKQKQGISFIPAIKIYDDQIVHKDQEIAKALHKYYTDLYINSSQKGTNKR